MFEHEWILEPFAGHPTFFTKRMFGGLAAYLFDRQMLLLVEPTKSATLEVARRRFRIDDGGRGAACRRQ
jgi:hypothetical protein